MLGKTNLSLGVGVALYFLPHIQNKIIFFPAVLISSLIPDLGSILAIRKKATENYSSTIFHKALRNYLTPIALSVMLSFFYPLIAFPFFLGYSFTLSLDAFTVRGVQPFWPIRKNITKGPIRNGSAIDKTLFYLFVIFDIALLLKLFI